jgi:hypothetical protein
MSGLSEQEVFNKAYDIVSNADNFDKKCSRIKKYYLAFLGNPNFVDANTSPQDLAKKALEHYEDAENEIVFAIVDKFIEERF